MDISAYPKNNDTLYSIKINKNILLNFRNLVLLKIPNLCTQITSASLEQQMLGPCDCHFSPWVE